MREQINNNPLVQVGLVAVLILAAGFFLLSSMGKGGESESESTEAATTTITSGVVAGEEAAAAGTASALAQVASTSSAPPPPHSVLSAWHANHTVALLFVHDGGIDDRLVRSATKHLASLPDVSTFVVPAKQISRYASITEGVGVDRVPALVVLRPKHLDQTVPTASVSYGFQSGQSVVQAVIDAGYKGPTIDYHP
jgi:hypothetical protein